MVETLPDKGNELVIELLATPTPALRSKVLFDTMTQAMNPENPGLPLLQALVHPISQEVEKHEVKASILTTMEPVHDIGFDHLGKLRFISSRVQTCLLYTSPSPRDRG